MSEPASPATRACPGCGLQMPRDERACNSYYHVSPECWSVYTEVLAEEYRNAVLFGRMHQLTVDAYAVQHAGGSHPDRSVGVHLVGLHLVHERAFAPPEVPAHLQRLASRIHTWPHFEPPIASRTLTVFDIACATDAREHDRLVREWSHSVWRAWHEHHASVARLAASAWARAPAPAAGPHTLRAASPVRSCRGEFARQFGPRPGL